MAPCQTHTHYNRINGSHHVHIIFIPIISINEVISIQQMYNTDKDHTLLRVLATDIYDNLISTNSDDFMADHLNL